MPRLLTAVLLALALLAVAALPSADARKGYCKTALKGTKTLERAGGVIAYKDGGLYGLCSDKLRRKADISILDPGEKVARLVAVGGRCAAVSIAGGDEHAQIAFKDLKSKEEATGVVSIGYGAEAAKVASMAMASNCGVAWGESVTTGGATTYTVRARGVSPASALPDNSTTEVATVDAAAIRGVRVAAAGKGLKVSWPGGSQTVPAGL